MILKKDTNCFLSKNQLDKLKNYGYIIIDNFLPNDLHDSLLSELISAESTIQFQVKPSHYSHVFKSENKNLPQENEVYLARFKKIDKRESLPILKKVFEDYLAPVMKAATQNRAKYALYPAAVRVGAGDVFRTHQDSFAGLVGFSFFLNKGWKWDYGGILTYVRDEEQVEAIFPLTNRLLLRNEEFKHFHFLNTVEQFSLQEQHIILGWADESPGDAFIYGNYHKI